MKIKVKGLVFFGFAAAVFAQSAMATITPSTEDKKVVASKYYVDSTFQEEEDKVTTANIQTIAGEGDPWASATLYPSMQVVKGAIDTLAPAVGANATSYVDFTESGNTWTVNFDQAPATTAAELTGYDATTAANGAALSGTDAQKLVTTGAVNSMILREDTNGTTINSNATNGTVPTSKNVYDFVTGAISTAGADYQPKLESTDDGDLYVGQYDSDSTWKRLDIANASGQNPALASTNYVAKTVSGDVYTVNLDSAQIADSIATDASAKLVTENAVYDLVDREVSSGTSTIGSQSTTLVPTSKNVYDFVNNGYQVKATAGADTIEVGHDGAWANLVGDSTYTNVAMDSSSAKVSLINVTTGSNATEFVPSSDTTNAGNRTKLARAGDVYDFVTGLTGGLVIPAMPSACTTASLSGGYCALVYGLVSGTAGQDGATYGLQWTVMAQPSNP